MPSPSMARDIPEKIRFGPFEADLATGELRYRGSKVRLEPLPFGVLVLLLQHPNEIVARAQLIKRVWQRSNFEAFDQHLGQAIRKIRAALNDSTEKARYIETVPGEGYKFLGPVETVWPDPPKSSEVPQLSSQAGPLPERVNQSISSGIEPVSRDAKPVLTSQLRSQSGFYGGEGRICAAISLSYGIMVGLALPAELAYRWPEFRQWAVLASLAAGVASAFVSGLTLRMMWVRVAAKHFDGRAIAVAGVLCFWTMLLALAAAPWLPNESIVQASWQTLTAKVGFAKSLLEALGLPVLSLVPVQAVFALRQLIGSGDIAPVREVLTRRSGLAMISGALVPGPMFSVASYAVVTLWWLNANAHLLENLKIAPYYPLFVEIAAARASAGLITLLIVLLWYLLRWNQLMSSVSSSDEVRQSA